MDIIKVTYEHYRSMFSVTKALRELENHSLLGFDVECRSVYELEEIEEAKSIINKPELVDPVHLPHYKQVARSSGLSHPSLVRTTHFIFGLSSNHSVILIADTAKVEMFIWNWLIRQKIKFVIHNSGFDLKICYNRTGKLPSNFEDTMLIAKTLINNAENWKAKTGLKELVGGYFNPKWCLFEDYNVKNYTNINFLEYCAIDGAGVYLLYEQLQEHING